MPPFIYIIGKTDPQRASAKAIREAGYRVGLLLDARVTLKNRNAFDSVIEIDFDNLSRELERLAHAQLPIAGLLCTYENYILSKSMIAEALHLPAPSVVSARRCTDKYLMRQAFHQYDPSITPEFAKVTSLSEALGFAKRFGYPVILKPANLVKSLLVLRCDNEQELRQNVTFAQASIPQLYDKYRVFDRQPTLIIEQYITGKMCSVAAFVDAAGIPHFCDGIVSLTTAQDIGVADNYLYCRALPGSFRKPLAEKIFFTARKGIAALGLRSCPAHVELMYTDDSAVRIIEIGARIGGYRPRMYKLSYGLDLPSQEIALAVGKQPELTGAFRAYSAVYELFPVRGGQFARVHHEAQARAAHLSYYSVRPKPGMRIGPAKNGYKAVALIIITGADATQLARQQKIIDTLRVTVQP